MYPICPIKGERGTCKIISTQSVLYPWPQIKTFSGTVTNDFQQWKEPLKTAIHCLEPYKAHQAKVVKKYLEGDVKREGEIMPKDESSDVDKFFS